MSFKEDHKEHYKERHQKEYQKIYGLSTRELQKYARDQYHKHDKSEFKAKRRGNQVKALHWVLNQVQLGLCRTVPAAQCGSALVQAQKQAEAAQAQLAKEQLYLGQHIYLNCNGCYENMNKGTHSPVLFLCGHVLCLQCTAGFVQSYRRVACPQCQAESPTMTFFGAALL